MLTSWGVAPFGNPKNTQAGRSKVVARVRPLVALGANAPRSPAGYVRIRIDGPRDLGHWPAPRRRRRRLLKQMLAFRRGRQSRDLGLRAWGPHVSRFQLLCDGLERPLSRLLDLGYHRSRLGIRLGCLLGPSRAALAAAPTVASVPIVAVATTSPLPLLRFQSAEELISGGAWKLVK